MIRWPWTNLHELNLDWIIRKMKELEEAVKAYTTNVTASATTGAPGSSASATVTGDLNEGLDFTFTIPQGATGATGATGPQGIQGERGSDFGRYVYSSDTPTTTAKSATSLEGNYTPVEGDIICLELQNGNAQADMTLSIDGGTAYEVMGWNGTTDPGAVSYDSNTRLLLYFNGSAYKLIGPRANEANPAYRRGGFLSDETASNLNFSSTEIASGTTSTYLYINKNSANPFFIVQLWKYTGMTYELMDPSEYTISGNPYVTSTSTLSISFTEALTYPVTVVVFGNAVLSSGM